LKIDINSPLIENEESITEEKINIMIWNPRSLNDTIKKIYQADIVSNITPDIIILMETFLRDDSNLFIKNYKTYKTRNIERRKGIALLIHKNLLVRKIQINNDINRGYIKLSIKNVGVPGQIYHPPSLVQTDPPFSQTGIGWLIWTEGGWFIWTDKKIIYNIS